jgi:hypothetical protein
MLSSEPSQLPPPVGADEIEGWCTTVCPQADWKWYEDELKWQFRLCCTLTVPMRWPVLTIKGEYHLSGAHFYNRPTNEFLKEQIQKQAELLFVACVEALEEKMT